MSFSAGEQMPHAEAAFALGLCGFGMRRVHERSPALGAAMSGVFVVRVMPISCLSSGSLLAKSTHYALTQYLFFTPYHTVGC